jgi:hypothetical protein
MPRSNNSNSSYSPKRATFKPYTPSINTQQKPYPYTPTIQSQPIQQRSFFGNIVDGFAFSTGATIARNMFSSTPETKIVEKVSEKKVVIDCSEYNKCLQYEKEGDIFLYNDCIKKLPNKINDYEMCILK